MVLGLGDYSIKLDNQESQVEVDELTKRDDGRIVWQKGKAIKLQDKMDKADEVDSIRKLIKKNKK